MTHTCLCSTQLAVINENSRLEHFKWQHDQYCWLLVGECVTAPRKMCICIYIPVFCFYTAVMWGATLVILNITILPSTIDTCILLLGERITRTTQPRSLTTDYPRCPLTFPVWTQHCFSWRLYCITNFCAFTYFRGLNWKWNCPKWEWGPFKFMLVVAPMHQEELEVLLRLFMF